MLDSTDYRQRLQFTLLPDSSDVERAESGLGDAQGTGVPPTGGSPASPTHPSPHRTRSTTCSAASTQASGSPTPSPARLRRGRRRVLGSPCWKPPPSQATRRMSAHDLPRLPQAPVRPFSENKNRCHLPRSGLPLLLLLPHLARRGPLCPFHRPPRPQPSSKSLL